MSSHAFAYKRQGNSQICTVGLRGPTQASQPQQMAVCLVKQDSRSSVEGQPQQMAVCLVKQDGRSSVAGQPQQMAVCLVEQDVRPSVLSLFLKRES